MPNKVKFGLKNVHYAPITEGTDGAITFGTPKRIPGAVNLNLDAQGDTNTFYADDVAYYVSTGNDGYSGTLEIALIPDDFRKDILGDTEDETAHVMVENAFAEPKPFALLYEIAGDVKGSRRVMYNCNVSRPGENAKTNEKAKTPQTDTMNLTATALADGRVRARTLETTPDTVFNGWFSSVWEPSASGASVVA